MYSLGLSPDEHGHVALPTHLLVNGHEGFQLLILLYSPGGYLTVSVSEDAWFILLGYILGSGIARLRGWGLHNPAGNGQAVSRSTCSILFA